MCVEKIVLNSCGRIEVEEGKKKCVVVVVFEQI